MPDDSNPRRVSLVLPIILITVGILFLVRNWHPAFEPWAILLDYWPLILIFVGLGKIQTVDLQGAKSARAKLEMGAGELTVSADSAHALDADFRFTGSYEEPRVDYHVTEGVGQIDISQDSHTVHFGNSRNEWNLRFGKGLPLELRVDMGAGQGNLDFRDIPLTRLDLHLGAGEANVDLTGDRKADLIANIEGGVGQANIRLPKKIGVIAQASGGIGSIRTSGLKQEGGSYTNETYGKSPVTIHLKVTGGIGEIVLNQEP